MFSSFEIEVRQKHTFCRNVLAKVAEAFPQEGLRIEATAYAKGCFPEKQILVHAYRRLPSEGPNGRVLSILGSTLSNKRPTVNLPNVLWYTLFLVAYRNLLRFLLKFSGTRHALDEGKTEIKGPRP